MFSQLTADGSKLDNYIGRRVRRKIAHKDFYVSTLPKLQPETQRELVSRDDNNITVADITQLYVREQDNPELLHHAAHSQAYQV